MLLDEAEQKSAMQYLHVDKENIGAFGMSFGGAAALDLTRISDLIKASAYRDGFCYNAMWQEPIKKSILLMQMASSLAGHFLHIETIHDLASQKQRC